MIKKISTPIAGCYEIQPDVFKDNRGRFIKTFHQDFFQNIGLPKEFAEEYVSTSRQGVLRGLHFQRPPHEQAKLIYCSFGEVLDVAVDIRRSSPTYGKFITINLSADKGNMAYVATGCAHGFYTLSETAVIVCKQSTIYNAESDACVRWDSFGIDWPNMNPILSDKDKSSVPFNKFVSPFN